LVVVGAAHAVHVPEAVSLESAAALMLQGMTAHYLVNSTFEVTPGHDVLLFPGAGGVGLLATQLAAARGGRVITAASTPAKAELSHAAGAWEVLNYAVMTDVARQLPAAVQALTDGAGVHVVYDGVGRTTFDGSLRSLRRRGMLVLFGAASGQVPPFDPQLLNRRGSLFVTRPTLADYVATREELDWRAGELFAAVAASTLDVHIGATFPLADAAEAHRALEGRATTGKVLVIP
jgi:NADPH2:quinone reductase